MYNHLLDTFVMVADCGSFLKASEKLYISPTAVMKQMNLLEKQIGLPLLARTNQGVRLTDAGKSLYQDAKKMIQFSQDAVARAYQAQKNSSAMIRIGTSALYPCKVLTDLWNAKSKKDSSFKLKIIPFEDMNTPAAYEAIGKKYDLLVGPHNSVKTAKICNFLKLGQYHFCIAVPKTHPLAEKTRITYEDLHGERILIQARGNSPVNDAIRDKIEKHHPQTRIVDVPAPYNVEVFNRCLEENCVLLSLNAWNDLHPSLVSIPLETEEQIPYGVLYALHPSPETIQFLDLLQTALPVQP